ncbi:UNVERIFIED_CONTAM: Retrovirus-related Pol polyprotein from transposon TNT 1-94 [Sesamum latifolium]|uniref:Retrovirus-related Pol polyprotein from transposon TNT 1-94 n=1 Tax=Sesamum latifolium TaxID=2727402 RepID=A0AAW2XUL0_9LAMI
MTKKPFVGQSKLASGLLNLIHTDVCGPLNTLTRGGYSYFITFTDDRSRYGYVYLMRYKYEALGRFKEYRLEVENQISRKIKTLRSDRGGEYVNGEFIYHLKENEILSQWTPPETPQLNGMAERRNQTLLDMVYKLKHGSDGEVTAFKARLVVKGYTQRPGVDFEETYSPVVMAKFIRILLAIAAWYDYEIWQMDVKTAFLNGFIEKEIYMDQLEGFTSVGEEHKVCHLQRSIYGLKQASRSWNTCFDEVIRGYDFIKNAFDPCVYKKIGGSSVVHLVLYINDILLIGNEVKMLGDIKV